MKESESERASEKEQTHLQIHATNIITEGGEKVRRSEKETNQMKEEERRKEKE